MSKMNGKLLKVEQWTGGYGELGNVTDIQEAINAWARRRGLTWDGNFRSQKAFNFGRKNRKGGPSYGG